MGVSTRPPWSDGRAAGAAARRCRRRRPAPSVALVAACGARARWRVCRIAVIACITTSGSLTAAAGAATALVPQGTRGVTTRPLAARKQRAATRVRSMRARCGGTSCCAVDEPEFSDTRHRRSESGASLQAAAAVPPRARRDRGKAHGSRVIQYGTHVHGIQYGTRTRLSNPRSRPSAWRRSARRLWLFVEVERRQNGRSPARRRRALRVAAAP